MEDRLKKFVTLVDAGSFTAAAEQLHTSQPALSNAIQKLERELKAPLIERGTHTLTDAGKLAYEHGKRLQVSAQNLSTQLTELSGQKPSLRIGMIDALAEILFLRGNELNLVAKDANITLTIENSARLLSALDNGELDVAFVAQQDDYASGLQIHKKVGNEPLVVVTKSDELAMLRSQVASGKIEKFLGYHTSTTQRIIQRATTRQGIDLNMVFSASPHILLGLVLAGEGTAALPYFLVRPHIQSGKLAIVELGGQSAINRPIVALVRKGTVPPKVLDNMISRASGLLHDLSVEAYGDVLASTEW